MCVFVQGRTALHNASEGGHPGCVALLLRAQANIDLTDIDGSSFIPSFLFSRCFLAFRF